MFIGNEPMSHANAVTYCHGLNAELATINKYEPLHVLLYIYIISKYIL